MIDIPYIVEKLTGTYRVVIYVNDTWSSEPRIARSYDSHDIIIRRSADEVELTLKI